MTEFKKLDVLLADTAYPILIGNGLLPKAGEILAKELGLTHEQAVFVVSEETVASHWLTPLAESLMRAGLQTPPGLIMPPGEASKSFAHYQVVVSHLLKHGIKRDSVVLALGGGVMGDLVGFAAATVLRGVRLVQVPTTLLAQVDSAVGGKTGINTPEGKNLVGSFHQPALVLIDPATLNTLPPREIRAGYAEILKYGVLGDATFFDWLEKHGAAIIAGDAAARAEAILRSCQAKATIVAEDPWERKGRRALLNLGHTFGHALEALGGYDGRLLHGEAVSIGMRWALRYSVRRGLCPEAAAIKLEQHLRQTGLMMHPPFGVGAAAVAAAMQSDKKNTAGHDLTLVLCKGIGQAVVTAGNDTADVTTFIEDMLKETVSDVR